MPKCKTCGSRVPDGITQCPMCGTKISESGADAMGVPQTKPVHPIKPKPIPVQPAASSAHSSGAKCKVCGSRVPAQADKCPMCGAENAGSDQTPQKPPVQPASPTPPYRPAYSPPPPQNPPPSSYQPAPQQPSQKPNGCLRKIISTIITIFIILFAIIFILNGYNIDKTVSDVGDIASSVADNYSTPQEIPLSQYQVTTYQHYKLHPENYYGKYIVFKGLLVSYLDRDRISFWENSTQTTFALDHQFRGQDLDRLAEKYKSFNQSRWYDTVNFYCYISKGGIMKPITLE